jgi:hypothetical protein
LHRIRYNMASAGGGQRRRTKHEKNPGRVFAPGMVIEKPPDQ